MPWPIRLLPVRPAWDDREIGDAWWSPADDGAYPTPVGMKHRHLPCVLWVTLPGVHGHYPFCVHAPATVEGPDGAGWDVTGEAPNITVRPSIDVRGSYHGFITNGVIADDVEGRTYGHGVGIAMTDTNPAPAPTPTPTPDAVADPAQEAAPALPGGLAREVPVNIASRYAALDAAHAALLPKAQEVLEKALKRELVNDAATDNQLRVALALVTGR